MIQCHRVRFHLEMKATKAFYKSFIILLYSLDVHEICPGLTLGERTLYKCWTASVTKENGEKQCHEWSFFARQPFSRPRSLPGRKFDSFGSSSSYFQKIIIIFLNQVNQMLFLYLFPRSLQIKDK